MNTYFDLKKVGRRKSYTSRLSNNEMKQERCRPCRRIIPPFLTKLYRNSFFPSTTLLWNNLPVNIQESSFLLESKRYLTMNDNNFPRCYYLGKRTEQIIYCRLRLEMSDLNFDLFSRHLIDNPTCPVVIHSKPPSTSYYSVQTIGMKA